MFSRLTSDRFGRDGAEDNGATPGPGTYVKMSDIDILYHKENRPPSRDRSKCTPQRHSVSPLDLQELKSRSTARPREVSRCCETPKARKSAGVRRSQQKHSELEAEGKRHQNALLEQENTTSSLQRALDLATASCEEFKHRADRAEARASHLKDEMNCNEAVMAKKEHALIQSESECAALLMRLETAENEAATAKKEPALIESETECAALLTRVETAESQGDAKIDDLQASCEMETYAVEYARFEGLLAEKAKELETLQTRCSGLELQLEETRSEASADALKLEEAEERLCQEGLASRKSARRLEELERNMKDSVERRMESRLQQFESEAKSKAKKLEEIEKKLKNSCNEAATNAVRLHEMEAKNAEASQEIRELGTAKESLQRIRDELEVRCEELMAKLERCDTDSVSKTGKLQEAPAHIENTECSVGPLTPICCGPDNAMFVQELEARIAQLHARCEEVESRLECEQVDAEQTKRYVAELEARCVELEAKLESEKVHAEQTLRSANEVLQCKMLELEQAKAALKIVAQQDVVANAVSPQQPEQGYDGETRQLACIAIRDAIIRALVSEQKEDTETMEQHHPCKERAQQLQELFAQHHAIEDVLVSSGSYCEAMKRNDDFTGSVTSSMSSTCPEADASSSVRPQMAKVLQLCQLQKQVLSRVNVDLQHCMASIEQVGLPGLPGNSDTAGRLDAHERLKQHGVNMSTHCRQLDSLMEETRIAVVGFEITTAPENIPVPESE